MQRMMFKCRCPTWPREGLPGVSSTCFDQGCILQVSSIVDAFQRSVPLHMQQRPSIGAPGIRPFAAAYPPPHGSIAPLKHVGSDRPNTAFSNGELSSGDFGDFGHGPPAMFNAAPPPPANPFVKAVSSEFGVGEISSKRARHGS